MLELDHFNHGLLTPILAYLMSFIGSVLGLRCAVHARSSRWPGGWLVAAAVALGGCGIWVMHFTAMLGFSVQGMTLRYDVPMTLLSAAIAIVVVWIGLSIVVRVRREILALPIGGAITGVGVAAMHYLGMSAMHVGAHVEYNITLVALSVVIAVVAATAALWFMLHVHGFGATLGAAVIMGLAVCGMHYTGMAAMSAQHGNHGAVTKGVEPVQLLTPLIMTVTLITMMLIVLVGLAEVDAPSRRDSGADDEEALADSGRSWPRLDPYSEAPRQAPAPQQPVPTAVSLRAASRAADQPGRSPR
ncbi:MHYT domain-containing protein [Nocardia mexicana]|uniref:NO-binding membrane sensor protein with MHYT domain n=1 Tax=Nocardia mexicana TaxID=279262 RepID=A0A370GJY1_9NOCA|nr:MHYT domain-containing protein [Nocardia mexicana]RDI43680.1 NO-binding membrane sensor protein with MHYT domain [Nocardia mexicana]